MFCSVPHCELTQAESGIECDRDVTIVGANADQFPRGRLFIVATALSSRP